MSRKLGTRSWKALQDRIGQFRWFSRNDNRSVLAQRAFQEHGSHELHHARRLVQEDGPSLADFIQRDKLLRKGVNNDEISHLGSSASLSDGVSSDSNFPSNVRMKNLHDSEGSATSADSAGRRIYFETYGCQMNVNDLEIVLSILSKAGYSKRVDKPENSDVILINTCAIRDKAEQKVWHRLNYFKHLKERWLRRDFEPRSMQLSNSPPKVVVLGCMAERLKHRLLDADKLVDVVCGPDAYRDLPRLLSQVDSGQASVNTMLSLEETYADVSPIRVTKNAVSAFVSIMRGCDNMCSYCIVPFTRGRERSRPADSILREIGELWGQGVKEAILLGQNVNSYRDTSPSAHAFGPRVHVLDPGSAAAAVDSPADETEMSCHVNQLAAGGNPNKNSEAGGNKGRTRRAKGAVDPHGRAGLGFGSADQLEQALAEDGDVITGPPLPCHAPAVAQTSADVVSKLKFTSPSLSTGFSAIYRPKSGGLQFAHLLRRVSEEFPAMRFRFTSPHPKDFPDELLEVMRERPNVCLSIHLPAQSGSTAVLSRMRRGYSREAYLQLVEKIRRDLPGVAISSDFITGFCGETEEEHRETLSLIEHVGYDMAYMFAYSLREGTHAHRKLVDDVSSDIKKRRLGEMIEVFRLSTKPRYESQIGQIQVILVEGVNKRAPDREVIGKNDSGHRVVVPNIPISSVARRTFVNNASSASDDPCSFVRMRAGDYVEVEIVGSSAASLRGIPLGRSSISLYNNSLSSRSQVDSLEASL